MWPFSSVKQAFSKREATGRDFSDEERLRGAETTNEIKRQKALEREADELLKSRLEHLRKLQNRRQLQEQIDELEEQLFEPGEDSEEEDSQAQMAPTDIVIMGLIAKFLGIDVNKLFSLQQGLATSAGGDQASPALPAQDISESEINGILDQLDPRMLAMAQKKPDDEIKAWIRQKYPLVTEASVELALGCLKKRQVKA